MKQVLGYLLVVLSGWFAGLQIRKMIGTVRNRQR